MGYEKGIAGSTLIDVEEQEREDLDEDSLDEFSDGRIDWWG